MATQLDFLSSTKGYIKQNSLISITKKLDLLFRFH